MFNKLFSAFREVLKPADINSPDDWRCFRIVDGKISPPYSCEINAVDQCNLACMDCNHASPAAVSRIADPDFVFRDLSALSRPYKAAALKVIGGEPLLHPDLPTLLRMIRKASICRYIVLVTNGILLPRMSNDIWAELDEVEVSIYPETEQLLAAHMPTIQQTAERHRVKLSSYFYEYFRVTFSSIGTNDTALTRRIYRTCKLANAWGCQSVHEGYFFKCPQSIYIPWIFDRSGTYDYRGDGVMITGTSDFQDKLKGYLSSKEPLRACRHCLGSVGKLRKHKLLKTATWKSAHSAPTEALVDYDKLCHSENGRKVNDMGALRVQ